MRGGFSYFISKKQLKLLKEMAKVIKGSYNAMLP